MNSIELKTLDKGFVRLVDSMGNDSSIVQAARVSYADGTKTLREDEKLIDYLIRNDHLTPLEMVEFKFHIKCPIFVARQMFRHRTASINEVSARYSIMKDEFYIPELSRMQKQSTKNKQGSEGELSEEAQRKCLGIIRVASQNAYAHYEQLLKAGLSRELARMVLPVNLYTEFYWKIDLRNLLNFIRLRSDSHAQKEIVDYSNNLLRIVKTVAPVACKSIEAELGN